MVIGKGLVATSLSNFSNNNNIVIFASGVSNSKCIDKIDFDREINLLTNTIETNIDKTLVYFSTCSIYDESEKHSAYVNHKLTIEAYIKQHAKAFYIFRVSNLVGQSANANTIFNYFINHIKLGNHFNVWQYATRNFIDIDDLKLIIDEIIIHNYFPNSIINIANPISYKVTDIIKTIETKCNLKGNYTLIDKGATFEIDSSAIAAIVKKLQLNFGSDYLEKLITKYYLANDL
jgi:nucleoside-diphosphate-sugar epimerase